jgi:hypothetical protein
MVTAEYLFRNAFSSGSEPPAGRAALQLGVRHLPGQDAAASSEIFLDRREGPNAPVSNYTSPTIIGDRRRNAEVRNGRTRPRAKDDRVYCSQAQFSEHNAVVKQIASRHKGSTLWQSPLTMGLSMAVATSRMSCKSWRC